MNEDEDQNQHTGEMLKQIETYDMNNNDISPKNQEHLTFDPMNIDEKPNTMKTGFNIPPLDFNRLNNQDQHLSLNTATTHENNTDRMPSFGIDQNQFNSKSQLQGMSTTNPNVTQIVEQGKGLMSSGTSRTDRKVEREDSMKKVKKIGPGERNYPLSN